MFDTLNEISYKIDNFVNLMYSNKLLVIVIIIIINLYSMMILQNDYMYFISNMYVQFIFLFILAVLLTKNIVLSTIISIILIIFFKFILQFNIVDQQQCISPQYYNTNTEMSINDNTIYNNIPVSPRRAQFIDQTLKQANYHIELADKAKLEGNVKLANSHYNEVIKQNIKVNSALQAKLALVAAKNAENNNDYELASKYINEVQKNNAKIASLISAESLKSQASAAFAQGDTNTANLLNNKAILEEKKVELILQADEFIKQAKDAYSDNNDEVAKKYLDEAFIIYDKINELNDYDNSYNVDSQQIIGYDNIDYANY